MNIKGLIVIISMLLMSISYSHPVSAANCSVSLKVTERNGIPILGKGTNKTSFHTIILKPTVGISNSDECSAYKNVKEIHLGNVEQHDVAFQNLKEGDLITGTLNYHRPSPHGKYLHDNFHHGLRVHNIAKSISRKTTDYAEQYIYFRHIGLY